MEINIFSVLYGIGQNIVQFFSSSFLVAAVKFFLFVYIVVLFIDIVLLLVFRGVSSDIKKTLFGTHRPLLLRSTAISRSEKILDRLKSNNPSQYKAAILEADAFADEILAGSGYKGATMTEKLESVQESRLETRNLLMEAHLVRNRIVNEVDLVLSREETEKWLAAYRAFFTEAELF
jgi:hypothetical protein